MPWELGVGIEPGWLGSRIHSVLPTEFSNWESSRQEGMENRKEKQNLLSSTKSTNR